MRFLNWLMALLCVMAVAACGGGGGSSGTTPFPAPGTGTGGTGSGTATVTVAISSTAVTTAAPVTVTATVKDATGAALVGQVVTFTTTSGLGTFSPGSALTDGSGVAAVQLAPATTTTSGADDVVATVTINSLASTASVGFTVTPTSGPVGTPSLALLLSTTTVTTTTPATVTASLKDANGGAVAGQVISFSTPGLLGKFDQSTALTDANGNAVVHLSPATVTTTGADTVVASASVNGTALTPVSQGFQIAITNADLILTVSSPQISNTSSASVTITATAIDSNRNTVAGVPVTLTADQGAVLTGITGTTSTSGTVTGNLGIGSNRSNRLITLTAVSGAITRTATVQVVGANIVATLAPAVLGPGDSGAVQYRLVDQSGSPMVGQDVQLTATGFTPASASGTTGLNGDFTFSYTAPTTNGTYPISATIAGKSDNQSILVQSTGTVPSASSSVISAASIAANPSVISTNLSGSSTNQSQIRALFLGANNLPIQYVRAKFDLNGDVNSVGGTFTTGATTLYSDANGVVTTAYVPGTRSSPTDGVTVRVCYGVSDNDPNFVNCLTSKLVTLTVTSEPLGVSIGTDATIIDNGLTFIKQYVVTVSDSAGVAKADVNLAVSLDLQNYRKGQYAIIGTKWTKTGALPSKDSAVCANEDVNRNGVLEAGEDINNDGILWPRQPDVIVSLLQSTTGSDGTAILQIQYAKDHGSWVDALITVSASGVSGSEGRASYFVAPVPVDTASLQNLLQPPAYQFSPYGIASSCSNPN